jgi:hypothetical protein
VGSEGSLANRANTDGIASRYSATIQGWHMIVSLSEPFFDHTPMSGRRPEPLFAERRWKAEGIDHLAKGGGPIGPLR